SESRILAQHADSEANVLPKSFHAGFWTLYCTYRERGACQYLRRNQSASQCSAILPSGTLNISPLRPVGANHTESTTTAKGITYRIQLFPYCSVRLFRRHLEEEGSVV